MRIAMVCHGNICRSPMAETVARTLIERAGLSDEVVVESFGTSGYNAGEGADPRAEAALRRAGWPARSHRSRRLGAAELAGCDLILCADRDNLAQVRRVLGAEASAQRVRLLRAYDAEALAGDDEIPDPWYGGARDFDSALEMIERACRGLVDELVGARR